MCQVASFPSTLRFTYSLCRLFIKSKNQIQKLKEAGYFRYKLEKVCFQYNTAYGGYKKFTRVMNHDKVLFDKTFEIVSNQRYDGSASII